MEYKLRNPLPHKDDNYLKTILLSRGVGDVETYLNPDEFLLLDPQLLDNIEIGVEVLYEALKNNKKIYLQVDSDGDGVSAASVLYNYIMKIFPNTSITVDFHEGKQHGVIVEKVSEDIDLVILPDSGSNQFEEHRQLKERGITTLVLDHHLAEKESEDAIIINNQLSAHYPNKSLSGAGVVYKFCQFFDVRYGYNYANDDLDLVAVGIVADMCDLRDFETRTIVHLGLQKVTNNGLLALVNKNAFLINDTNALSPVDISFSIAPHINAIIRVGTQEDKETLFLAFTDGLRPLPSTKRGAASGDIELACEKMARIATNARNRQQKLIDHAMEVLEGRIKEYDLNDNKILVVFVKDGDNFNSNITGLIAMKLTAKYGKPTLLIKLNEEGIYKGSLRGIANSELPDFKQFLNNSGFFEYAEGHSNAAGVGIRQNQVESFIAYANYTLQNVQFDENVYLVDYIFQADQPEIHDLIQAIGGETLWGQGVEIPLIVVERISVPKSQVSLMKRNSCKFVYNGIAYVILNNPQATIDWFQYDHMEFDICGKCNLNEWGGRVTPQVMVVAYNVRDRQRTF